MANYNENDLDKLLKKDLISMQRKIDQDNAEWLDEIRKLIIFLSWRQI